MMTARGLDDDHFLRAVHSTLGERYVFLNEDGHLHVPQLFKAFGVDKLRMIKRRLFIRTTEHFLYDDFTGLSEDKFERNSTIHVEGGNIIHETTHCDGCLTSLSNGVRWKCAVCDDFDFCAKCYHDISQRQIPVPHDPSHHFIEIAHSTLQMNHISGPSLVETFLNIFTNYSFLPCLGVKTDPTHSNEYSWFTYRQVMQRFVSIGSGLRSIIKPRDFVGIFASNCFEWLLTDLACIHQSFVSIGIHTTYDDTQVQAVMNNAEIKCLVCTTELLSRIEAIALHVPSLKFVVVIGELPVESTLSSSGVQLCKFDVIEKMGLDAPYLPVRTRPSDISTIIYTSGSTGVPKGAAFSDDNYVADMEVSSKYFMNSHCIRLEYLPFSHATSRDTFKHTCIAGGRTALHSGDLASLFEELAIIKPTHFVGVPAVWNRFYAEYKRQLALAIAASDTACSDLDIWELKTKLRNHFSTMFGDRLINVTTGTAATDPKVFRFLQKCFRHQRVVNGYGATEVGGISANNVICSGVNVRLEDVPEMNYLTSDQPFPRGEICVHSKRMMFVGYFKNDAANKQSFTSDGFWRTGDIGERREDGRVFIIDRKRNLFKMAQGEFVAPERLEGVFTSASEHIAQMFVHGEISWNHVVAVVVPKKKQFAAASEMDTSEQENSTKLREEIQRELFSIGALKGLNRYEIPHPILLELEDSFTAENGLLTPSLKLCRHALIRRYGERLNELYASTINAQASNTVRNLVANILGRDDVNDDLDAMAVDSTSRVRLASMIKSVLGKEVPLDVVVRAHKVSDITEHLSNDPIDENQDEEQTKFMEDMSSVLGDGDHSLQEACATRSSSKCICSLEEAHAVLLTGASGFLGGVLLDELLRRFSHIRVKCLVRSADVEDGRRRVDGNLRHLGLDVEEDAKRRIDIVSGDLSKPDFGLDRGEFCSLADSIEAVFHCGAAVNWLLPYTTLRHANVEGTRTILRLAMTGSQLKPLFYVSTVSVASTAQELIGDSLDFTNQRHSERRHRQASGYSRSKWMAEVLVRRTAAKVGLPTIIFRPGMVTAHSRTGGCNHTDFINRLLRGSVELGAAIDSEEETLEFTPVDLVARVIVELAHRELVSHSNPDETLCSTFHIANPNVISYSALADLIRLCGFENVRKMDYGAWRSLLQTREDCSLFVLSSFFTQRPISHRSTGSSFLVDETLKSLTPSSSSSSPWPSVNRDLIQHNMDMLFQQQRQQQ